MHQLQELVRLHRMGTKSREVARLLRMSTKTEVAYRAALSAAGLLVGDPAELPDLDVLRAAVLAQRPPRPAPQCAHRRIVNAHSDDREHRFRAS